MNRLRIQNRAAQIFKAEAILRASPDAKITEAETRSTLANLR